MVKDEPMPKTLAVQSYNVEQICLAGPVNAECKLSDIVGPNDGNTDIRRRHSFDQPVINLAGNYGSMRGRVDKQKSHDGTNS